MVINTCKISALFKILRVTRLFRSWFRAHPHPNPKPYTPSTHITLSQHTTTLPLPLKTLLQMSSHYNDVIMSAIASQITGIAIVCSILCSGADKRKRQSSASLAFMNGIHRWPVDSPHKGPVTREMFPFYDVNMRYLRWACSSCHFRKHQNVHFNA